MRQILRSIFQANRVFAFLVIFRWASLLPVLLAIAIRYPSGRVISPFLLLGIALAVNSIVSLTNRKLNKLVVDYPVFLSVDLAFTAGLLALSGGSYSPYYLYALSPLLASAFFFQMRGALLSSLLFTPLYLAGTFLGAQALNLQPDILTLITQLTSIWLIPIIFAYSSTLLKSINQANEDLANAHRQLEIIHDLTILLQAAPDLISVEERVLGAVTKDLGFSKAVVAMVNPAHEEIGNWLVYPPEDTFPQVNTISLRSENGEIIKALLNREDLIITDHQHLIQDHQLNQWLQRNQWLMLPLYLREHPVGVLLVEKTGLTKERESTLRTVANQAALALGTTTLCIDRARRLAVETERNRIARDIHDTVAQSLFGIVYSLDACINMLPTQADDVKKELIELRSLANSAHDEVRRSIFDLWPSALTVELFMADLTNYVSSYCRQRPFSIIFNHNGDFNSLSPGMRRTVYRMAQEALANSARHSGAPSARLCMTVTDDELFLVISDEGKGFDPQIALSRSQNREHFGLHGIQERARAIGGDFEVSSQPNAGTRIMISLPVNGHHHHV